jgi:hypothetical protein
MDKLSMKYFHRRLEARRTRNHKICLKKYVCTSRERNCRKASGISEAGVDRLCHQPAGHSRP